MPVDEIPITAKERIAELKQLKQLANQYLDFYSKSHEQPQKDWQRVLSDRNILLLKNAIVKINKLLHDDKIEQYIVASAPTAALPENASEKEREERSKALFRSFAIVMDQSPLSLLMKINECSPRLSYFNDLTWFEHGTVQEHLDYGLNKCDESVFEKYLPDQMERITETKKSFFLKEKYKDDEILFDAILVLIKDDQNIPANVLIITLIEGLARKFCLEVYKKQNPEISDEASDRFAYVNHHSLSSLINSSVWKADIPITFSELLINYKHTHHPIISGFEMRFRQHMTAKDAIMKKVNSFSAQLEQENKRSSVSEEFRETILQHLRDLREISQHLLKEEDQIIWIGLNIYLNFLVTQFTSERNQIIHGKYSFFKEKWKTLFYLTALQKLMGKIMEYENLVDRSSSI